MTSLLIVNPHATTVSRLVQDVIFTALRSLGPLEVKHTKHRQHAFELARDARARGIELVVAFSGDGTLNEIVNGLLAEGLDGIPPRIAALPGGHANVFVRSLGFPRDPVEATGLLLEALSMERYRTVNLGRADDRYFLSSAGMGFDAEVLQLVDQQRGQGGRVSVPRFVAAGLLHYARSGVAMAPSISVTVPGQPLITDAYVGIVQNGNPWTYVGNLPVTLTPEASFDRALDAVAIHTMDPASLTRHLARAAIRPQALAGSGATVVHDVPQAHFATARPLPFQVDGDVLGERSEVTCVSVPQALAVASPITGGFVTK